MSPEFNSKFFNTLLQEDVTTRDFIQSLIMVGAASYVRTALTFRLKYLSPSGGGFLPDTMSGYLTHILTNISYQQSELLSVGVAMSVMQVCIRDAQPWPSTARV